MNNLKSREQFLTEKVKYNLIKEYSVQNNNPKWSSTLIGRLFNSIWRTVTLNGFLTDKFKDIFGAKSFIIKNIAKRLEKAIDKLPQEYVDMNNANDLASLEMQYYDDLYKTIDILLKSKNVSLYNLEKNLENVIKNFKGIKLELDSSDANHKYLLDKIDKSLKVLNPIYSKVSLDFSEYTEEEAKGKIGYDFSKKANKLGDKISIKKKVDSLKASLRNIISKDKDSSEISTESTYKIISLLNKARNIYLEEDISGETIYRGNKKETVFNPNKRLFSLWEDKVLDILSRKSSIIPKKIISYINSSLASIDPVKYEVEVSPGVKKNILDELSDIDKAEEKVKKKFDIKNDIPSDVVPYGKSESKVMYFKEFKKLTINREDLVRSLIQIKVDKGVLEIPTENGENFNEYSFNSFLFFLPIRSYVNGLVLGVLSYNMKVFNPSLSTFNHKVGNNDFNINENEIFSNEPGYKYAVINSKTLSDNSNIVFKLFDPGAKTGVESIDKLNNSNKLEIITTHELEYVKALQGDDDKIVELKESKLKNDFALTSLTFKSLSHYFNSNKF